MSRGQQHRGELVLVVGSGSSGVEQELEETVALERHYFVSRVSNTTISSRTSADTVLSVRLRERLLDLLSRGSVPEPDPDELVDVETVQLIDSAIAVERLREVGIDARAVESFDPVSALTRVRVMVPRRQLAHATEVLDSYR